MGHKALDPDQNDWAHWADTSGKNTDIVNKIPMSAFAMTLTRASCIRRSAGASNTCKQLSDTDRIARGNNDGLINFLGNALPAFFIEITEVGGGEILVLLVVIGLLLVLVLDADDGCLCILPNLGVISVGALDNIGSVFEERPRVRPAASKAAEGATTAASIGGGGTIIPASAILS